MVIVLRIVIMLIIENGEIIIWIYFVDKDILRSSYCLVLDFCFLFEGECFVYV